MSFGFPLGLLSLLSLAPILAAYFLRRRQKPRTVSAVFLWRTKSQRAQAGPRLQRFSREASILLEALAVVAAALFLSDLRFGRTVEQRHLVLVVDGSLSMAARPPTGKPVAERVRLEAARLVERERVGLLTVVESGVHPRVLAGPQVEATRALAALEKWRPQGPAHDLVPAAQLGKELAGGEAKVHLLTDGPLPAGAALPPEVELTALGQPADNLALVSAQRRDEGELAVVTVRVASYCGSSREVAVRFEGPSPRLETIRLEPGATAAIRLSFPGAGPISVALPDDALIEDGRARLLPSPVQKVRVRLLSGLSAAEAAAVRRFLEVAPGVLPAQPDSGADLTLGPEGSGATVQLGAKGALKSFVGPFFTQKHHPLLEDVGLSGVLWTAGDNPNGRPVVTAGDTVLISEEEGALRLNLELSRSNVQRTAAWPVLLGNAVRRARLSSPGFQKRQLTLGEEVPVVTEPGGSYTLEGPSGARAVLGAGAVTLPPLSPPGTYRLLRDGEEVDALEVLAIDPRESDLRDRGAARLPAKAAAGIGLAALADRRAVWPLVLLLVLLLADFSLTARER
ncbi:MAG: VWA domain-containing protein [Myxococcales bacterium]|nr:VWA domain-containing protein [Myxococcales bacterium]